MNNTKATLSLKYCSVKTRISANELVSIGVSEKLKCKSYVGFLCVESFSYKKKKLLSRELQVFNDVDIRMFDNWELKLIK